MARIGVEGSLSDVRSALESKGYDIVELKQEEDAKNCDCCVITGQDKDVMGMSTRSTDASVINADGMTADQVVQEVESRLY